MKRWFAAIALTATAFTACITPDWSGGAPARVAAYTVEDGELVPEAPSETDGAATRPLPEHQLALHRAIWERMRQIVPKRYQRYIKRFVIDSDGSFGATAFVGPVDPEQPPDPSAWTLGVDIVDAVDHMGDFWDEELDRTLIHEFAHILSLNSDQADVIADGDPDDLSWIETWDFSRQYRTYNNTVLRPDSYLNRFFLQFWGADLMEEWIAIEFGNDKEYWTARTAFSVRYHTDFVSEYAMSNPDEDFAESFLVFVVEDEMPQRDLGSHRKVRFFYDFPELVAIRDQIRAVLPEEYDKPRAPGAQ